MRFAIGRTGLGAVVALGVLMLAPPLAAQQGEVTGRVTDKASGQSIAGAQVSVVGMTLRALTGQDGRYRLINVPAGAATIRVAYIGYGSVAQPVTVPGGGAAEQDIALSQVAVGLDAVVVTATGDQAVREQGTVAHNVDLKTRVAQAPTTNLSDALNSTVPGVVVQSAGGTTGTGTRIRIRGSNSVSLSNEPVLVVDGVRVENSATSSSVGVGGQQPSRLNDISPQDLEAVQVASGPASSVLYGTDAANGAILMRTRRGQPGPTRWTVSAEGGVLNDYGAYPTNYTGLTSLDSVCTLTRVAVGTCTQARVRTFNPIEQRSPFRTGHRAQYGISAAGGTEQTTFYVSGHFNNEEGVYSVNENRQINLLANLFNYVRPNLDFQATVLYASGKLRLPQNDNNSFGVLSSGFLGGSDSTVNAGYGFLQPAQSFTVRTFQNLDHFTGSVQANYRPLAWLEAHAVVGTDFVNRYDENTTIPGRIPAAFSGTANEGNRNANPFQIYNWTGNFYATASFALTPSLNSTTSGGLLYYHLRSHGVLASVQKLTAGTNSLAGGVIPTANEQTIESVTLGRFVEERLGYKNRLFVTAALRSDDNTSFGRRFGNILYPRLSGSWVVSEEPFFPTPSWLGSLKVRAAYGASGLHPGPTDALQFFTPTPVVINNTDVPGITIGGLGNSALKPERTNEVEFGFDSDIRPLDTHVGFTYFSKASHDALIAVVLPPSCGCGTSIFRNLGSVTNKGVEISANATLVNRSKVKVELYASAWGTRSRVKTLGPNVAPIIFGLGGATQRIQPGYAPGSYFQVPYTYSDANGDGIIALTEVTLGTASAFQGQPFPDHGGSLSTTITLSQRLHVYGLADGRFGNKLFNSTEQFRCGVGNCAGRNDPNASLAEQAAAVANIKGTQAGYMESADFIKLRELSLTYDAPAAWASRVGAASLSITIAGRNLATWTKYTGLDPELNEAGQNNFTTADFLTQPPVRYWIGRVNMTF
ncbi:MAG TPA: SusC/RagA family TonB-linked outer membrane protein [Gemmatimonadales bacterium]|jgi:TonB-linked SusC/RagA family outer membrane protein|nr:SusC/RagA family TonB-linked outer membrane protein [Gemmatimonadales bacterium]